ncbi:hypothetical protein BGY98DRAFT_930458 [Russula aff. rugulosa BPL654]|nr:hypothetical protein BGY98DRAFT_930458 [Russula aff. rugulosa BPL654]
MALARERRMSHADLRSKIQQRHRVKKPSALSDSYCANATIIRPSLALVMTSHQRFAQLSRYLPVYGGDIGLFVEILARSSPVKVANGKIIEAAGPDGKFHSRSILID